MDLSIIIVNWNTKKYINECLSSIYRYPIDADFEVIVVDNDSEDGSGDMIRSCFPQIQLIENKYNSGFGKANNQAKGLATGEYIVLLNSDTLVHENTFNGMFDFMKSNHQVFAIGPKLLNEDGTLQVSAFPAPTLIKEFWRLLFIDKLFPLSQYPMSTFSGRSPIEVEVLNGACMVISKEFINRYGLFDEDYFMYSEEVDLCERIRKHGGKLQWYPNANVTHYGGKSTGQIAEQMFLELYRNKVKFFRKHRGQVQVEIYKRILWIASIIRIVIAEVAVLVSSEEKAHWKTLAKNYRILIHTISDF